MIPGADQHKDGWEKGNGRTFTPTATEAATEAAKAFTGWGTALKPACEPCVLARKPLISTVAANVLAHGTGALNIDGCRAGCTGGPAGAGPGPSAGILGDGLNGQRGLPVAGLGRWPANVIHDGSEEVVSGFPSEAGGGKPGKPGKPTVHAFGLGLGTSTVGHNDSGSAARFFYTAKADAEDRLGSKHPTVKPVSLMRYLVRLVTPPGGVVLDPFAGSGSTGVACIAEGFDFILIEREAEYVADIKRRIAWARGEGRTTAEEMARDLCPASAAGNDLPLFADPDTSQPASQPASPTRTPDLRSLRGRRRIGPTGLKW